MDLQQFLSFTRFLYNQIQLKSVKLKLTKKKKILKSLNFFPSKKIISKKAKLITCISMFYDLEDPLEFVKNIKKILYDPKYNTLN